MRGMLDPNIFQGLLVAERHIVDVSRSAEHLRRYIRIVEWEGGDASRDRNNLQNMRRALDALRVQRDQAERTIRRMSGSFQDPELFDAA